MSTPRMKWLDQEASDFAALLQLVPDDVLASPRRSVVPLLEFCRNARYALTALGAGSGVDTTDATDLLFEYDVPVQKGRGKPSFTDLLILTKDGVIGVEAKYTEPEYESVRTWLREPRAKNREEVLSGWLHLIRTASSCELSIDHVLDLPYQLVHRVASACFVDRSNRAVMYLVFGSPSPHYGKHMQALAGMLGDHVPALVVVSCCITPTAAYAQLLRRWDAGERHLGPAVREALCSSPLMSFDQPRLEYHARATIGGR